MDIPELLTNYFNQADKIMGGMKYYERTKLIIELIEKEKTGSPSELAEKLGVTKRTVFNILDDLRLTLPTAISYDSEKKSYVFLKNK
ncbi:HTH domain-containing protein [Algoriphagus sp. AGSA1]|uniref:HTH domain-containing protein n=1 Tax=Algoriphagus sp. AGSA1 TaxID=2907213 RepID=UPI00279550ED|nr:HTH domain-containing protein [Algoriphagus sp. AGSA1]